MKEIKKSMSENLSQTAQTTGTGVPKKTHSVLTKSGNIGFITCTQDSCQCERYDVLITSDGYQKTFPRGTIANIGRNDNKASAINRNLVPTTDLFTFLANNSDVEWGMTLTSDSAWIYTDREEDHVAIQKQDNMTHFIHSHLKRAGYDLSDQDKQIAESNRDMKCFLYYDKKFLQFGNAGFYSGSYDYIP